MIWMYWDFYFMHYRINKVWFVNTNSNRISLYKGLVLTVLKGTVRRTNELQFVKQGGFS